MHSWPALCVIIAGLNAAGADNSFLAASGAGIAG